MIDSTSGNSSANIGTSARDLGRKDEFLCRSCSTTFFSGTCWEWPDGSWLCTRCKDLASVMVGFGEIRCTKTLAFLSTPRAIRTGWDS